MRADNSRHIIAAARRRAEQARQRAITALRRMDNTGQPVTFEAVAATAGVSRSWLYAQADVRVQIERLRQQQRDTASPPIPSQQRATAASLHRRLEAATARIRNLEADNQQLRDALAHAIGAQRARATLTPPTRRDTPG
jgi:small-conductance mechanosensitive channel